MAKMKSKKVLMESDVASFVDVGKLLKEPYLNIQTCFFPSVNLRFGR